MRTPSREPVRARPIALRFWRWLRAVSGDSAYEDYRRRCPSDPVSREAFYLESLRRRYARPNRCC